MRRRRPKLPAHRPSLYTLEPLESRTLFSAFYDVSLITAIGEVTTNGDTINSIAPQVSINDNGLAAYVASVSGPNGTGTTVVVDDAASNPVKISFANPIAERQFAFPQINNAGLVAVRDNVSGVPGNPSFIRTWDSANPGAFNVVAASSDGVFSAVTLPTLTNSGGVGFIGLTGGGAETGVYFNSAAVRGDDVFVTDVTGSGGLRPMATIFEKIVVRDGTDSNAELQLLDAANIATVTLASTASGFWTTIGSAPGISDRGRAEFATEGDIVVFYGDLTPAGATLYTVFNTDIAPVPIAPGPGVFAAVPIGSFYHIVRIAGESGNGFIDPGERRPVGTANDVGPDFDFNRVTDWQIGIGGFSASSRVGITDFRPFVDAATGLPDPAKGSWATVVYLANDTVGNTGLALYTSRLNLFKDAAGSFSSIGVEAAVQVARVGDNVQGFGVIQDIAPLHDPINNNGEVAFLATNASGLQGVLVAERDADENTHVSNTRLPAGSPPQIRDLDRFDPDSPLVEYLAEGPVGQNARVATNEIIIHATVGRETSDLDSLTSGHSVHYYVTREGRVVQIVPESDVATHAGTEAPNANLYSIGIELEDAGGHRTNANWAQDIQLKKAALLVRDIALRNGIPLEHLAILPSDLFPAPANRPNDSAGDRPSNVAFVAPVGPVGLFERLGTYSEDRAGDTRQDGYGADQQGILSHGQVFHRSVGKDDPRIFDWASFMTRVNNGVGFTLNSPANLLVTDPMGRRIGVDPATGQTINEIPDATFTGIGTEPESIAIPNAIEGEYQVQVVGSADGVFHLDFYAASLSGELVRTQVADQTSVGAIARYSLNYTNQVGARATVTAASNLRPVAFDDEIFTRGSDPVELVVLANDSDPEGLLDASATAIVDQPDHGTAVVDPVTGVITYTPSAGFVGDDSFQYEIRDASGLSSAPATVVAHVLRPTQPPTAVDDARTTPFDTPIAIDVLANDSDSDGTLDPSTVQLAHHGEPLNGTVDVDPVTGQLTYTPDPDFAGTDSFEYVVLDNDLAESNSARVTITVLPPTGPEVSVRGNGVSIVDGDTTPALFDHTDFGVAVQNQAAPVRVFTVSNIGPAALTLGPVSVPAGFTLVEPLATTLAPGATDTFTVQLGSATLGTYGGEISFATNDPNENPFNFTIEGKVAIPSGSLDLTFGGGDGKVTTPTTNQGRSVVVQPDGKIIVGGIGDSTTTGFTLARYNPDGSIDTTFGGGDGVVGETFPGGSGTGEHVLLRPDGKIVLVGLAATATSPGIGVMRFNADGSLDTTFDGDGRVIRFTGPIGFVEEAALQADGKIVVVATHSTTSNDFAVARFNADGTVDATFGGGDGLVTTDFGSLGNDVARAVAIDASGKIVVAGVANGNDWGLARYNTDGTPDTTFGGGGLVMTDFGSSAEAANGLVLQPDGKIVVVGVAGFPRGVSVARYNVDGSPDTSFSGDGRASAEIGEGVEPTAVALQADGKIVVAGSIQPGNQDFEFLLTRFTADGSLDAAFGAGGAVVTDFAGFNDFGSDVAVQADGKIVVAGTSIPDNANFDFAVARYYGDATVLPTVTLTATDAVGSESGSDGLRFTVTRTGLTDEPLTVALEAQNDGVAGQATLGIDYTVAGGLLITIPAGAASVDVALDVVPDAVAEEDELITLAILARPEYFIGTPFIADGLIDGEVQQVALDGRLDPAFGGGDGQAASDFGVGVSFTSSLALQPDGKVLVAARVSGLEKVGIARFRMNGIPDPSFDNDGLVITPLDVVGGMRETVAVQPDGKVIAAGVIYHGDTDFAMVRYLPNGALDTTFGGGDGIVETNFALGSFPFDFLTTILVDADGRIYLGGQASTDNGGDFAVARYDRDGNLDPTFDGDGLVTTDTGPSDSILALALQPDGKIVAVGSTRFNGFFFTAADASVVRYNHDGSLDTSFGGTGIVTTSVHDHTEARGVAVRADGKIVVAGSAVNSGQFTPNSADAVILQYNSDGSLDTTFGGGDGLLLENFQVVVATQIDAAQDVEVQPDGQIVVTGTDDFGLVIARYNPDGTRDTTFGGGTGMATPGLNGNFGAFVQGALQPDGKLVVSAMGNFGLIRFSGPFALAPSEASIAGVVFDDADGDGVRDAGETGLPGWTVRLDLNNDGTFDASTVTSAGGAYTFANVTPGTHAVREVLQAGWAPTAPAGGAHVVTVAQGDVVAGRDFGNRNEPPVAGDDAYSLDEDQLLVVPGAGAAGALFANDSDPSGDAFTATVVTGPSHGTLPAFNSTTGAFSYRPAANYVGPDSFVYRIQDGHNGADTASVSLTVRPIDDAPVAAPDTYSTLEDTTLTVPAPGLLGNDTDVEGAALTVVNVSAPTHGTAAVGANGALAYTPAENYFGPDSFTYQVSDGTLVSDPATVTLTVVAVNDAPVLAPIGDRAVDEGQTLTFSLSAADVDSTLLTFSASGLPAGATFDAVTRVFSWTPSPAQGPGTFTVTFSVSDGELGDAETIDIDVNEVAGGAPVLSALAVTPTVAENGVVTLTGSFNHPGTGAPFTLAVAWGEGAPDTVALDASARTFALTHRYLDDDPSGTSSDTYAIQVVLTDAAGNQAAAATSTSVRNVAPTATLAGPTLGLPGAPLDFGGSFTDPGTRDRFEVAWDFGDGASVAFHAATDPGALVARHAFNANGEYTVTLLVRDDDGGVGAASLRVAIGAVVLQPDICDPDKTELLIVGTSGDDKIRITQAHGRDDDHDRCDSDRGHRAPASHHDGDGHGHSEGGIEVWMNGRSLGVFQPTGRVVVYGQEGNDDIEVADNVTLSAELYGGAGNDRLQGAKGADILVGGSGDDRLSGGGNLDILIGGAGADRLVAGSSGSILIAGPTAHDEDRNALCKIFDEWTRTDVSYATRVAHLTNGGGLNGDVRLNQETVGDDRAVDKLTGGARSDWFIVEKRDKIDGRSSSERVLLTDGAAAPPPCAPHTPMLDWSGVHHGHAGSVQLTWEHVVPRFAELEGSRSGSR